MEINDCGKSLYKNYISRKQKSNNDYQKQCEILRLSVYKLLIILAVWVIVLLQYVLSFDTYSKIILQKQTFINIIFYFFSYSHVIGNEKYNDVFSTKQNFLNISTIFFKYRQRYLPTSKTMRLNTELSFRNIGIE